jgi:Protein of unknown function (DUF1676)
VRDPKNCETYCSTTCVQVAQTKLLLCIFSEARKKDKGGLGYVLMMGLMMGKMMAALGFGAVGAMALKALGVSMMALMLASIIGIKKLSEGGGGGEHHVQYVSADHHRKRREVDEEVPLPYRAHVPEH